MSKIVGESMVRVAISVVVALLALVSTTASVGVGRPEDVGLSAERLQRVNHVIQHYVDAKEISGAVTVVARRERVAHFEAHGVTDIESKTPMRKDAIFRIASMTKPVTAVAVLMLVEEGKIQLRDPVARFIPQFNDTKVAIPRVVAATAGQPSRAPDIYLVPANREITIRDLLTHTSGLVSGGAASAESARVAPRNLTDTLAVYVPSLGAAPLDFQPGTEWRYSGVAGFDTLARVVEVVSGQTFDQFLRQRIFEPLGMKDTSFYPTDDRKSRVVTLYLRGPKGLERNDGPPTLGSRTLLSGGAGLWSTAEDYLQFAQMLLNGGELGGKRLLSPRTVDLMASNHTKDLFSKYEGNPSFFGPKGMGFGLGVEVVLDPIEGGQRRSVGSFGWYGAYGTHFWVDPRERLTAILLIQGNVILPLFRDFENAVMQAIVD
jgi:CubicO group peptidase (beta-lactamase class C family)